MSEYQRIFDSSSPNWSPEVDYNLLFIQAQQNYYNDMLKARGHVFLNEVYGALGFPHTPAGAVVGWTMSRSGDRIVEFQTEEVEDGNVRIDFNVDGFILDKLGKGAVR